MEGGRGYQIKHPYVVGLRSSLEASLSESMYEELDVSEEYSKSIVEQKARNIKALVVAFHSLLINTKLFPFPILEEFWGLKWSS